MSLILYRPKIRCHKFPNQDSSKSTHGQQNYFLNTIERYFYYSSCNWELVVFHDHFEYGENHRLEILLNVEIAQTSPKLKNGISMVQQRTCFSKTVPTFSQQTQVVFVPTYQTYVSYLFQRPSGIQNFFPLRNDFMVVGETGQQVRFTTTYSSNCYCPLVIFPLRCYICSGGNRH